MSSKHTQAILVFQKNLVQGKVKTRLAASLGEESALKIYHHLVQKTHESLLESEAEVFVFYSDFIPEESLPIGWRRKVQHGKDLGKRMYNAFQDVFDLGFQQILIVGTDCPYLDKKLIETAFDQLKENDLVIGPALDGGYYLLGLKQNLQELFENINWSTSEVYQETIQKATIKKLKIYDLTPLEDIDTEVEWNRYLASLS